MLVILSGVETTNKKAIATEILSKMTGTLDLGDGYSLNLAIHPYEITDAEGTVVFRGGGIEGVVPVNDLILDLDNDGVHDEAGQAILDKAEDLYNNIILNYGRDGSLKDTFVDIYRDYGVIKTTEFVDYPVVEDGYQATYETDIIDAYNNRKSPIYVITGSFGKHIIDRVREDLGSDNVVVLNIVRHPSVCFLLDKKPAEYYTTNNRTVEMDNEKLRRSIFNAVHLSSCEDITTVKYEDLLTDNKVTIAGTEITLPEVLKSDNGFLTNVERDDYVPQEIVTAEELTSFNETFSNFDHLPGAVGEQLDILNAAQGTNFTHEDIVAMVPANVFTELGYQPMTRDEIINK